MQHPDITLILVHALHAARTYLEERGRMPVFAYVLPAAGGGGLIRVVANKTKGLDRSQYDCVGPDSLIRVVANKTKGQTVQQVIEQFRAMLKREALAVGHRAVAIITAERLHGSGDGASTAVIQVAVDHSSAPPVVWQVPFRRVGERYEFGTRDGCGIMKPGESFIFPKEEVLAHKECQRLLDLLGDERLKSIARLKMMGIARCLKMEYRTNEEVAEQLGQFVRTVERKLGQHVRTVEHKRNLIRLIWADEDRLARGD